MRRFLLAILLVVSSSGYAAAVDWQNDPAAALTIAKRDQKLLLVYYRIPVRGKTVETDRAIAAMERDALFVHALDAFVPLRIDGANAEVHPIVEELQSTREPLLAIYDASGTQVALFKALREGWKAIAEDVLRFRSARALLVRSATLRAEGDAAGADFVLGHAMRGVRRMTESIAAFERSVKGYATLGDDESEQLARLGLAASQYADGRKQPARLALNEILHNPATQSVEAEAQLLRGGVIESIANTPVSQPTMERGRRGAYTPGTRTGTPARANPGALTPAIAAYRKAYELAARGSSTEATARAALERLDKSPLPSKGASASGLSIIPPIRATFTGHSQFRVDAPPATARVEFLLDEQKVATSSRAPFRAAFDVGSTPRVRVVKARAFDASGALLGETALTINDRLDNFYVTIVNPASSEINGRAIAEVDVKLPPGRAIDHVLLSWNGKTLAKLTSAPFRAPVEASSGSLGYLHARATLDDGSIAEATRVYNAELLERVEVAAVTVLASVADPAGEPVRGLTADDFVIEDQGTRVTHELLSSDDDPVTIGIAIDSSSSMTGRQLYSIRAAATFLERALRPNDKAFIVGFDTRVSLVHPRSSDVPSLRASILGLMPAGGTSIFDGVTFALQQFQGIPGRKALIVISDGREGTSSADARDAERLARTVGVPIYLFVPPYGERLGHALREMSGLTGGTMYHAVPEKDFEATWDRVAEELRAQYVLQYRMPGGVASGAWREIRVTVPRRDVTVRTIAGYRAN